MSYFKQLLRNNLIICLCYTVIFTVAAYYFTTKIVKTESDNAANTILTQISGYVDNAITQTTESMIMVAQNTDVVNYINEYPPSPYARMRAFEFLSKSFGYLPSKDSMIAFVREGENTIISNTSNIQAEYFIEMLGTTPETFYETMRLAKTAVPGTIFPIISDEGYTLTMVACLQQKEFRNPLYFFMSLPMQSLVNYIQHSNAQMMFSLDDLLLYASDQISDQAQEFLSTGVFPKGYKIFSKTSAMFLGNITYYYLLPKSTYRSHLTGYFLLLYLIFTIFLVLGLVLVYFLTKKVYAPIQGLLETFDKTPADEKQDELSFIKNSIKMLVTNNDLLNSQINEYKTPLESAFLQDLLYDRLSPEAKEKRLSEFALTLTEKKYITALIEFTELKSSDTNTFEFLQETIIKMFSEHFAGYSFFRILPVNRKTHALIVAIDNAEKFQHDLRRFLLQITHDTGIELFASVGSVCDGMKSLSESFSKAQNVSENRIYGRQYTTLCTPDDVGSFKENGIYYPFDIEASIIENVVNGNLETVKSLAYKLISTNFIHKPFSAEQFSQFVFLFTATFNRIFSALNKKCSDFFPEDTILYLELKSCREPKELFEKISELLEVIVDIVRSQISNQDIRNMELMKGFIAQNYKSDISLLDLAEHMNFSSEHTSRLFKQLVGQNFKEYLMHYRFERAKEIMQQNPGMKIKDVATAVGCNSTAILSRSFIKYAGMSPGDYMKSVTQN